MAANGRGANRSTGGVNGTRTDIRCLRPAAGRPGCVDDPLCGALELVRIDARQVQGLSTTVARSFVFGGGAFGSGSAGLVPDRPVSNVNAPFLGRGCEVLEAEGRRVLVVARDNRRGT